jgi:hypothetical protein
MYIQIARKLFIEYYHREQRATPVTNTSNGRYGEGWIAFQAVLAIQSDTIPLCQIHREHHSMLLHQYLALILRRPKMINDVFQG